MIWHRVELEIQKMTKDTSNSGSTAESDDVYLKNNSNIDVVKIETTANSNEPVNGKTASSAEEYQNDVTIHRGELLQRICISYTWVDHFLARGTYINVSYVKYL